MKRDVISRTGGFSVMDGGVRTSRVLGLNTTKEYDPFLLLDCYDSSDPAEFRGGFPPQPSRGMEMITYLMQGTMLHRDTMKNDTRIESGDVQWMTCGSGVQHTEAFVDTEHLQGVRIWLNLPKEEKMDAPEYHIVRSDEIETFSVGDASCRLLCGSYGDVRGFQAPHLPLDFYDITIPAGREAELNTPADRSVVVFPLRGTLSINGTPVEVRNAIKLSQGDELLLQAGDEEVQCLFFSSLRTEERVVWGGTIIMTTEKDVEAAYRELEKGTFIR